MVAGLLLVARAVLPIGVARLIERQAGTALRARVEVGDVDLGILRGAAALEDVRVWEADDPPDAEPVVSWARVAANVGWWRLLRKELRLESLEIDRPRVAIDRLATGNLNLVALLPEAPPQPGGESPAAVPAAGAPSPERPDGGADAQGTGAAGAPEGPGWGVAVDRFVLRSGALRFRDLMIPEAEPIEIVLPEIDVAEVALHPGSYEQPGRLRLGLRVDRGRLDVDADLHMTQQGPVLDARLRAVRLPLRRTRVYVPNVGLSELHGEAGAALRLHYAPDTGPAVGGTLLARDLAVTAEGLPEPALAWRQLAVRVERAALDARQATVREVRLDGPSLLVRPQHPEPLPLLAILQRRRELAEEQAGGAGVPAEPDAGTAPTPDTAPAPAAAPAPPAAAPSAHAAPADDQPWRWAVGLVRLDDLRVILLAESQRLEVTGGIEVRDLAGPEAATAPVKIALAVRDGTLGVEGTARLVPVGFAGSVSVASLALPELVALSGRVPSGVLTGGTLGLGLGVEAAPDTDGIRVHGDVALDGLAASWPTAADTAVGSARIAVSGAEVSLPPTGAAGPIRVRGTVTVDALSVAQPVPAPLTLAAKRLTVTASEVTVPAAGGVDPTHVRTDVAVEELAIAGPRPEESRIGARRVDVTAADVTIPAAGTPGPTRVKIGAVRLDAPSVQATRTASGLLLPGTAPAPDDARAKASGTQAATPATPATGPAEPAAPAAAPFELDIDTFRLAAGRIAVTDRTVKPFYVGVLQPLGIEIDRFHFPGPTMGRLRLDATSKAGGRLRLAGALGAQDGRLELTVTEFTLPPFNPYATAASSYSIPRGRLSIDTTATRRGESYNATSKIVLHDFDLGGAEGDSLFQKQFGIPLTVALALLRDLEGDIVLTVPVESDAGGTRVGVGTVIAGALRQALLGALTSPLKLAGSLFGGGGSAAAAPATVAFRPGRDALIPEAEQQLDGLGQLLASRPGLGLRLGAAAAPADVRWLTEQDVAAELAKPRGLLGTIGGLAERGTRSRVAAALAARARGEEGPLEGEDTEALERWIAERPAPSPERLAALGAARVARVQELLSQRHGIPAARVVQGEPPAAAPAEPSLVVGLGAAGG